MSRSLKCYIPSTFKAFSGFSVGILDIFCFSFGHKLESFNGDNICYENVCVSFLYVISNEYPKLYWQDTSLQI